MRYDVTRILRSSGGTCLFAREAGSVVAENHDEAVLQAELLTYCPRREELIVSLGFGYWTGYRRREVASV